MTSGSATSVHRACWVVKETVRLGVLESIAWYDHGSGSRRRQEWRERGGNRRSKSCGRGARSVRVFGSIARGEAQADSDVDLLVELEPGRTVLDLSELILDLEEALGRAVDVVEIRRPSPLAERIQREAIPL